MCIAIYGYRMIVASESESIIFDVYEKWLSRGFVIFTALFFFLMLVLPTTFQFQRGVLLLLLMVGSVVAATMRWVISPHILLFWFLTMCVGVFGVFWGYVNGAPGALHVSTVYILWPLIFMVFVGLLHSPKIVVFFEKTLFLGLLVSALMAVALLIGGILGKGQIVKELFAFQGAVIVLYSGYVELRLFNLSTVIYGLPFLTALYFSPVSNAWFKSRVRIGAVLFLVIAVCVLSGRRAFWLIAVITPFVVWLLFFFANVRIRIRYAVVLAILISIVAVIAAIGAGLEFEALYNQFRSAFDSSGEQAASIRYEQLLALLSEWKESPLIGHGLGASAASFIRSEEMPWAYELSYVALLFQTGVLGVAIYAIAVIWIFYAGVRIVRQRPDAAQIILPLLSGLAVFLIANATNPYLTKFDYLWTIFLPVAAINAYRTEICN